MSSRIKINVQSSEFELEGTQEFIEEYLKKMPALFKDMKGDIQKKTVRGTAAKPASAKTVKAAKPAKSAKPAKPAKTRKTRAAKKAKPKAKPKTKTNETKVDSAGFKKYFERLPAKSSQNDQILMAGLFSEETGKNKQFSTGDALNLLSSLGQKVSNASASLKQLLNSKKVNLVGKKGRTNFYRLTDIGREYLSKLG